MIKKEQLRKIFVKKLTEVYFDSYDIELQPEEAEEKYIEESADELLEEVEKMNSKNEKECKGYDEVTGWRDEG